MRKVTGRHRTTPTQSHGRAPPHDEFVRRLRDSDMPHAWDVQEDREAAKARKGKEKKGSKRKKKNPNHNEPPEPAPSPTVMDTVASYKRRRANQEGPATPSGIAIGKETKRRGRAGARTAEPLTRGCVDGCIVVRTTQICISSLWARLVQQLHL